MDDRKIVDLYWQRDEAAISATAAKYGRYCKTIANNILHNVLDAVERKEMCTAINQFLSKLRPVERQVFLARYWFAASVAEISEKFGFTQSKVKSMLMRTRNRLRKHLEEECLC